MRHLFFTMALLAITFGLGQYALANGASKLPEPVAQSKLKCADPGLDGQKGKLQQGTAATVEVVAEEPEVVGPVKITSKTKESAPPSVVLPGREVKEVKEVSEPKKESTSLTFSFLYYLFYKFSVSDFIQTPSYTGSFLQ